MAPRWAADRVNAGWLSDRIESGLLWPLPGVWLGTSVEDQQRAVERVPALLDTPAAVRFLSCEPLLGPVDLRAFLPPQNPPLGQGLDWVIVGGESGPHARPMHPQWARDLRDQTTAASVAFLFKQWGVWRGDSSGPWVAPELFLDVEGRTATEEESLADGGAWLGMFRVGGHGGRDLDGRTWDEFPDGDHRPAAAQV